MACREVASSSDVDTLSHFNVRECFLCVKLKSAYRAVRKLFVECSCEWCWSPPPPQVSPRLECTLASGRCRNSTPKLSSSIMSEMLEIPRLMETGEYSNQLSLFIKTAMRALLVRPKFLTMPRYGYQEYLPMPIQRLSKKE